MTGPESQAYQGILRRVAAYNQQHGYAVELLTNNFMWEAETVAGLYKARWYIETFFRDIKQLLKIKTFVGHKPECHLNAIWTAMCAILLVRFLQLQSKYMQHLSNLVTFLRMNLFVKLELWMLLNYPFEKKKPPGLEFQQGALL